MYAVRPTDRHNGKEYPRHRLRARYALARPTGARECSNGTAPIAPLRARASASCPRKAEDLAEIIVRMGSRRRAGRVVFCASIRFYAGNAEALMATSDLVSMVRVGRLPPQLAASYWGSCRELPYYRSQRFAART